MVSLIYSSTYHSFSFKKITGSFWIAYKNSFSTVTENFCRSSHAFLTVYIKSGSRTSSVQGSSPKRGLVTVIWYAVTHDERDTRTYTGLLPTPRQVCGERLTHHCLATISKRSEGKGAVRMKCKWMGIGFYRKRTDVNIICNKRAQLRVKKVTYM